MPLSQDATDRIKQMKERELIDFIQEAVVVLETIVDRLETYAAASSPEMEPGFDVELRENRHDREPR
jgi:hypothetical protein